MANAIYNIFLKRSSGFFCCAILMAFGLETYINVAGDLIFDSVNKGLLWKDIKDNYKKAE